MDENTSLTMANPSHLGELLREAMQDLSWNVGQTAARLGVTRQCLSRVLNARGGVTAAFALALERAGVGHAEVWLRLQANYELARERRRQAA